MAKQPKRPKLDEIATPDEQNAWLTSPLIEDAPPLRDHPALADDPYDDRLGLLREAPEWRSFAAFLRRYIENAIFEPLKTQPSNTERGWWNITIVERGAAAIINIWRQRVLWIDFRRADSADDKVKADGEVYIDAETLEGARNSGYQLPSSFEATYNGKPLTGTRARKSSSGLLARHSTNSKTCSIRIGSCWRRGRSIEILCTAGSLRSIGGSTTYLSSLTRYSPKFFREPDNCRNGPTTNPSTRSKRAILNEKRLLLLGSVRTISPKR